MPTNEERREVARRLRKNDPSSFATVFDVFREIGLAVNPQGHTFKVLPLQLADLIDPEPERTCRKVPGRMKYGQRRPKCSECGYSLGDPRWFYCPKCGGRIEE